jgi:DNA-binding MarR family transcriptional regulator
MATSGAARTPAPAGGLRGSAEALFALLYMQVQVVRPIDDALDRAHHTNITGFEVLARLSRMHPDGVSVRYLADQVAVSPSRVSRVAEEFVGRGLLERAVSPHDGRLSLVRLTAKGRHELATMESTFMRALQTHFLDQLSPQQLRALTEIGHALGAPHC